MLLTHLGGVHFLPRIPGQMIFFGVVGNVLYPLPGYMKMFCTPYHDSAKCFVPPHLPQDYVSYTPKTASCFVHPIMVISSFKFHVRPHFRNSAICLVLPTPILEKGYVTS